jgi:hypothetical protein
MKNYSLLALAFMFAVACESKDDDDTGSVETDADADADADVDGDDTGEAPPPTYFSPAEGIWEGTGWMIDSDECNLELLWGFTEEAVVAFEGAVVEGGFTLTSGNNSVWTCAQAEGTNDLDCTATIAVDFSAGGTLPNGTEIPPLAAVITLESTTDGELTSNTSATSSAQWVGSCEGDDCATVLAVAGITGETCTTSVSSFDVNVIDFAPASGDWLQAGFAWSDDACNLEENIGLPGFPETIMAVTANEDGTFSGTSSASGLSYTCTGEGLNFTCEPVVLSELDGGELVDATITLSLGVSGRFGNTETYGGMIAASADCVGEQCDVMATLWAVEAFPCTSSGSTSAMYIGEGGDDADADGGSDTGSADDTGSATHTDTGAIDSGM